MSALVALACPACRTNLKGPPLNARDVPDSELECAGCGRRYPIRRGVPRLLPPDLSSEQAKIATAFGWQWQHFVEMHPQYEEQFLDWIRPLRPEFFAGKRVLDAGCGIGRHAFFAASYGAAEVVAMDVSAAVETARSVLDGRPNVRVVQGDILNPPFKADDKDGFDFVYSIGVIDHLPDPRAGFRSLGRLLAPGGSIFVWIYAHEGTGFVRHVVDPVRRVTSSMRPSVMRLVAAPLAGLLHGVVRGVYRPLHSTRLFAALPMRDYLYSISGFSFRQNYNIVFDQLVSPQVSYVSQAELRDWFREAGLELEHISWRNKNSWRALGSRIGD